MVPQVAFKNSMWTYVCKLLQFSNSNPTDYYLSNPDELSRSLICRITEEKDLSVWCTSDIKASLQVAMQTLGMLKRSFNFLSMDSFILLYRTYIRLHLQYCVPSWAPYLAKTLMP